MEILFIPLEEKKVNSYITNKTLANLDSGPEQSPSVMVGDKQNKTQRLCGSSK